MRQRNLLRSVQRLLDDGEKVRAASYGYARHPWTIVYALAAGCAMFVLVGVLGGYTVQSRVLLGAIAAGIAVAATTEYRIFASTTSGLLILKGSRFRLTATSVLKRVGEEIEFVPVGGNLVTVEWRIDGVIYSVPKRADSELAKVLANGR